LESLGIARRAVLARSKNRSAVELVPICEKHILTWPMELLFNTSIIISFA